MFACHFEFFLSDELVSLAAFNVYNDSNNNNINNINYSNNVVLVMYSVCF